jgi:hypothetical protein
MAIQRRHSVKFTAHKTVKEPTDVAFRTKTGERVDFVARKPVQEEVEVFFLAKNKKRK